MNELSVDEVEAAWARLARLDHLEPLQITVAAESAICPPGWIGILRLGGTITVVVPSDALARQARDAFAELPPSEATHPDVVEAHFPQAVETRGPAWLFYPTTRRRLPVDPDVETAAPDALQPLLEALTQADRDECGLASITSEASVVRGRGSRIVAACGHREWPNGVAHLCIATHPDHRRAGHAEAVGAAAIDRAFDEGLIPQWRARPEASKRLAGKLGFVELGSQLSLRPG
jgi:GNAT superfamily N-acetyltransferase